MSEPTLNTGSFITQIPQVSKQVADLEDKLEKALNELGEMKATLIINFGDNGKYERGVVKETDRGINMLLAVLTKYCKS